MASDPFAAHKSEPDHEIAPVIADPPANPFAEHELESERPRVPPSAQRLLCWIQQGWGKPVVSLRDICAFGPRPKDRQITLDLIKILVRQGWLVPMKAWRHDRQVWRLPPPGATPVAAN
jgi:hypothetical protein